MYIYIYTHIDFATSNLLTYLFPKVPPYGLFRFCLLSMTICIRAYVPMYVNISVCIRVYVYIFMCTQTSNIRNKFQYYYFLNVSKMRPTRCTDNLPRLEAAF